jgi:enamine deaminase RidA (YjgF/YER057c/UK114 family)
MSVDKKYYCRSFRGSNGDAEHFISITAPQNLAFEEQLAYLHTRHTEAQKALSLKPDTLTFKRIFLSDAVNQVAALNNSTLFAEISQNPVAVSIVQQPPLPSSKAALLAYHIESQTPLEKTRLSPRHLLVEKNGLRHLWSTRLCCGLAADATEDVQTGKVFDDLIGTLKSLGGNLKDHCVRTWLFIKDIDNLYRGVVDSRRALFSKEGLTENTHYIASTGIEGQCEHQHDLVLMDAYSILGLDPAQISYLNDFDHLCPPKEYKVTFERGTRIAYADRAHYFISGTASIDRFGKTVHVGDVMRQLDQTLDNIEALLKSGGASLDDLMYTIVYLRDPTDYARVYVPLRERFPDIPMVFVEGAVCRPEWLIEIEGLAIAAHAAPKLPAF